MTGDAWSSSLRLRRDEAATFFSREEDSDGKALDGLAICGMLGVAACVMAARPNTSTATSVDRSVRFDVSMLRWDVRVPTSCVQLMKIFHAGEYKVNLNP